MTLDDLYRALLTIYPPRFRRDYGDAMLEAFRDLRQTRGGSLAFWLFVITDTVRAASREWAAVCGEIGRRSHVQWMAACALGAAVCGGLGSAATWAFSYFYHPYLEGAVFLPWVYGALLGAGLAVVQAVTVGRRLPLRWLWLATTACCAALGVEIAIAVAQIAGPVGYLVAFGSIVAAGQWIVLRGRLPRAALWVLPSAGGLSAVLISTSATLTSALAGMDAVRRDPFATPDASPGLYLLLRGLYAPTSWMEFALGFAVMTLAGLLVGAITARPVSAMLARAR
jgi:hypothetical protein